MDRAQVKIRCAVSLETVTKSGLFGQNTTLESTKWTDLYRIWGMDPHKRNCGSGGCGFDPYRPPWI
jgi:hypothetical protein